MRNRADQGLNMSMGGKSTQNYLQQPKSPMPLQRPLNLKPYKIYSMYDTNQSNPRLKQQQTTTQPLLLSFNEFKLSSKQQKLDQLYKRQLKNDNPEKSRVRSSYEIPLKKQDDLYKTMQMLKNSIRQKSNSKIVEKYGEDNRGYGEDRKKGSAFLEIPVMSYNYRNTTTRSPRREGKSTMSPNQVTMPYNTYLYQNKVMSQVQEPLTINRPQTKVYEPPITKTFYISQIKPPISIRDFHMCKMIGQGKFGQVFQAVHVSTSLLFALKKVKKQIIRSHMLQQQFMMQIKMQLYFSHGNILHLYGMFDDKQHIYLILEYMQEGTLYGILKREGKLEEEEGSKKIKDILEGVKYLHENDVAHRDIKPENIVISNGLCKLCDFGWSAYTKDDRRSTFCGTLDYSAPQILQGKQYCKAIDMWCIGVLCYQLLVGKAPFYHISRKQTMKKIMSAQLDQINIPTTLSTEARDFIAKLIVKDPNARLTSQQALGHKFIVMYDLGNK